MSFTYSHERPSVSVDIVIFGYDPSQPDGPLSLLLIQRGVEP